AYLAPACQQVAGRLALRMLMQPELSTITRTGEQPFRLALEDGSVLDAAAVVRVVPGRRIVCRGEWRGQPVYAKLFIGRQADYYAARDERGVQALAQAAIRTPPLLYAGALAGGAGVALVFAAITDSVTLQQAWPQAGPDQRYAWAMALVTEVARHHRENLIQTDLYLKNFLLQGDAIYTLDGDGVRPLNFWHRRRSLDNLARLLSKFDALEIEAWLPSLLQRYADARGWAADIDLPGMRQRVMRQRRRAVASYVNKKIFRDCTDIHVEAGPRFFLAAARPYLDSNLRQMLAQPDAVMAAMAARLKSGNTCTVGVAEVGGRKLVVKRYNIKNLWHGLGRALRPTRAAASWRNAHRLRMLNIATAAPVALLEKRYGPIRRQAYFVAEYLDAPDVVEFFADARVDADSKARTATAIAALFYKLYLLNIAHGDFKGNNMKIINGEPSLIDLDSMRQHRCQRLFRRRHVRDLRRFLRNWQRGDAAHGLLTTAFAHVYQNQGLLRQAGIQN
ncbi:MAG TPA: lipopolysaccharide kinase InaA family protein, partial [Methylophilaceae bacterium]|nr:lipopolysaccharide kinase InaA family protein [Methylophilaceae bacterium]